MPASLLVDNRDSKSKQMRNGSKFRYIPAETDVEITRVPHRLRCIAASAYSDEEYVFVLQETNSMNNTVLKLPPDSLIIADINALVGSGPVILPWWPGHKKLQQWGRWLSNRDHGFGHRLRAASSVSPIFSISRWLRP
jgi:hypothetical protein